MAKGNTDPGKSKPWMIALIIILVLAVFGMGIFIAFKFGQGSSGSGGDADDDSSVITSREALPTATVAGGRGMVATPENAEELKQWAETPVEDGSYRVRMNTTWNFPDGKSASTNAHVTNAETNTRTVYFDVVLEDTREIIYSSPFIPVTAELEDIKLTKELEKGEYPAVVIYHLVDDNYEEITTVSVSLTINIEN